MMNDGTESDLLNAQMIDYGDARNIAAPGGTYIDEYDTENQQHPDYVGAGMYICMYTCMYISLPLSHHMRVSIDRSP
jgi:hypothetical protein